MTFEQIVTIISLSISVIAIIVSHLSVKLQIKYYLSKDKEISINAERNLCAEFLGYCKKAYSFGLSEDDLRRFTELYAKLYLIHDVRLRSALTSYCDAIITNQKMSHEEFGRCLQLYQECFKETLHKQPYL